MIRRKQLIASSEVESPSFEIYKLAKLQDQESLVTLLHNYGIDFVDHSNPFVLLAKDNNSDAIDLLSELLKHVKQTANGYDELAMLHDQMQILLSLIKGYAIANNEIKVDETIKQIHSTFNRSNIKELCRKIAIHGYARGGHVNMVNKLMTDENQHDDALIGFMIGSHVNKILRFLEDSENKQILFNKLLFTIEIAEKFNREHIIYHILNNDTYKGLILEYKSSNQVGIAHKVIDVQKKLEQISPIMKKYDINIEQAHLLRQAGIFNWMYYGIDLIHQGRISSDIWHRILIELNPFQLLNAKEALQVAHQVRFHMNQHMFFNKLTSTAKKLNPLSSKRKKAKQMLKDVTNKTDKELLNYLDLYANNLNAKDSFYTQVIEKHHQRLKRS